MKGGFPSKVVVPCGSRPAPCAFELSGFSGSFPFLPRSGPVRRGSDSRENKGHHQPIAFSGPALQRILFEKEIRT